MTHGQGCGPPGRQEWPGPQSSSFWVADTCFVGAECTLTNKGPQNFDLDQYARPYQPSF